MTLMDEVYQGVLPEMARNDIPDTTENRIIFLTGLLDGWAEDPDDSLDKSLYVAAVALEVSLLQIKMSKFVR
jgi:hypothetical protein